jgi:hypothetical protein
MQKLKDFERNFLNESIQYIPRKNGEKSVVQLINSDGKVKNSLCYTKITPFLWGMLFERIVGLWYEKNGYQVFYNGINMGVMDGGIDLICRREQEQTCYVQCKSGLKKIGKQSIEKILYNGGNYIAKVEKENCKFVLFLENENVVSAYNKKRFSHWNKMQSKVRLEIQYHTW